MLILHIIYFSKKKLSELLPFKPFFGKGSFSAAESCWGFFFYDFQDLRGLIMDIVEKIEDQSSMTLIFFIAVFYALFKKNHIMFFDKAIFF